MILRNIAILRMQRTLLLACVFFFACILVHGKYRFDSWTAENGLPQNSVNSILQTRDGYLWLSTSDGVARFDGIRFTSFNRGNTKGIASNRFTIMIEDRAGDLWIGTEDGGLTRYHNGAFKTFTTSDGLPDTRVVALQEDGDGNLLVLSGRGIVRRDGERFIPVGFYPEGMQFRLKAEQLEELWYVDASGLHRFAHNRLTTYTTQDGLTSLDVIATYEDQHGVVWAATAGPALHRFANGKTRVFTTADGLPADNVTAFVCEDRQGNLWMRSPRGGLGLLKNGHFTDFTTEQSFPIDRVNTVFEDREGNIWIGTVKNGLFRVREDLITTFTKENGLASDTVYPILQTRDGSIWIGTSRAGLTRYKDGKFQTFTTKDGLGNDNVFALAEDSEGKLWIGGNSGVSVYENGKFRLFYSDASLDLTQVQSIVRDRNGDLWFGAGNGLRRYRNGTVTRFNTSDGLAGDDVKALHEDRDGTLWIGTYGGVSTFKDGKFTSFTEENGLSSNHVRSFNEDADGTMWVGTYDGGLNRIRNGVFSAFTMDAGLSDNGAFVVLDDGRGSLWMSSNRGIHRVNKHQVAGYLPGGNLSLNGILYGKSDGMLNIECNGGRQPSGIKTSDNKLWFPTMTGVAVVDLALVHENPQPPPVVIESVLLDHQRLDQQNTVEIAPGETNLEIHYTGLSFIRSEQVRFKYRLVGLDDDWVDVGTTRVAVFSHLPPGSYTFNVIAANSDGVWNNIGPTLQVIVRPPFWRTWWFVTLVVLSVGGIAYSFNHRRISALKRSRAAQEAFSRQLIDSQENERKRIAAELHDGLGQNLLIIKNRALLGLTAPDDDSGELREQFEQISSITSQTLNEVREISYNLRPYQIDQLGLTKAISVMLKKVAQSAGVQLTCELDQLDDLFGANEEINFYRVVQEAFNNVVKHSRATEALVTIKREARTIVLTVQDNGCGFPSEAAALAESKQGGFGLVGIAERARMLGGKLVIKSEPGEGTTITLIINFGDARHAK
jgi:signal transduction histidine kinase/ligand-binding sensor domain-containing protein